MIDLYKYRKKRVRILGTSGKVFVGFVDVYTQPLDDPDGLANIAIVPDGAVGYVVGFYEKDIVSIEVLETAEVAETTPQLQLA
ncbi:MAG: hypothetical protein FWG65_12145 [Turicibacter sp.]|nr:hypothetical protein [Turicibacter sp.]